MSSQLLTAGAVQILTSVQQALPTNPILPIAAAVGVPVPTTPASPLTVQAPQPLAVMDPNASVSIVPPTTRTNSRVAIGALIALGGIGLWFLLKRK